MLKIFSRFFFLSISFIPLFLNGFTKVYVTSQSGEVTILNADTNTIAGSFTPIFESTTANLLMGIGVSPDGAVAYIADWQTFPSSENVAGIWVIDTVSDVATNFILLDADAPSQVGISPDGSKVYTGDAAIGTIYVISTEDYTFETITGGAIKPSGIAFNPSGTKVYIADQNSPNIFVYSTSDNSLITTIAATDCTFLAINPSGIGYAPNNEGSDVTVFDASTDTTTPSITTTGNNLYGVDFTNDGSIAYVASDTDGAVQVITDGVVGGSISTTATYFSQLAVNPLNNQQIYVAAHTVAVIENGEQVPNSDFDGYFSNAQYLAYIVPAGIPGAPTSLTGQVIPNKFLLQTDIVHRLTWGASPSSGVVNYLIHRNGVQIGNVSASGPLLYDDHNQSPNVVDLYAVIAVNDQGYESAPISISLP